MYEDDRQAALNYYTQMFDDASDEYLLVQLLTSPTKQAVQLARAYDAKDRKLQVHSDSRAEHKQDETPEYMLVLQRIRSEAFSKMPPKGEQAAPITAKANDDEQQPQAPAVDENQISMFDAQGEAPTADEEDAEDESLPAPEQSGYSSASATPSAIISNIAMAMQEIEQQRDDAEQEPAPTEEEPAAAEQEPAPAEEYDFGYDVFTQDLVSEYLNIPPMERDADGSDEQSLGFVPPYSGVVLDGSESEYAEKTEEAHEDEAQAPIETSNEEADAQSADADEAAAPQEEAPIEELSSATADSSDAPTVSDSYFALGEQSSELYGDENDDYEEPVEREARPLLLVLFIMLAIPVGLAGIVLLLLPTLLCAALGMLFGLAGVMALGALSGGFAVFADILVVGGIGFVAVALAILLLWLFVWFIGGAIVGLIRGLIWLGGQWCFKEVEAE